MKKIIALLILALPFVADAQIPSFRNLDTVRFSLTMRAQDYGWLIGRYGDGSDSITRAEVRNIRTQLLALNPPNWTTSVTVTKISGNMVLTFYSIFASCPFQEVQAMGNTNGERVTIYNAIRAITDTTIQQRIVMIDQSHADQFVQTRKRGKQILLDGGTTQSALKDTRIIIVAPPRGRN